MKKPEKTKTTCASCGGIIDDTCKMAKNPLRYKGGEKKGKIKKCCKYPDWRKCPNEDCESNYDGITPALICSNCGRYYGQITW